MNQISQDGSRIANIATSIHHAIGLLMLKTSPENIKCVCQTLKVSFPAIFQSIEAKTCSNNLVMRLRIRY